MTIELKLRKLAYETSWSDIFSKKETKGTSEQARAHAKKHWDSQVHTLEEGEQGKNFYADFGKYQSDDPFASEGDRVRMKMRHADVLGPSSTLMSPDEGMDMISHRNDYEGLSEIDEKYKGNLPPRAVPVSQPTHPGELGGPMMRKLVDDKRKNGAPVRNARQAVRDELKKHEDGVSSLRTERFNTIKTRKNEERAEAKRVEAERVKNEKAARLKAIKESVELRKREAEKAEGLRIKGRNNKIMMGLGGLGAIGGTAAYLHSRKGDDSPN